MYCRNKCDQILLVMNHDLMVHIYIFCNILPDVWNLSRTITKTATRMATNRANMAHTRAADDIRDVLDPDFTSCFGLGANVPFIFRYWAEETFDVVLGFTSGLEVDWTGFFCMASTMHKNITKEIIKFL